MAQLNFTIPDDLHRRAKAAAALEGTTLRDFVIAAIEKTVATTNVDRQRKRS